MTANANSELFNISNGLVDDDDDDNNHHHHPHHHDNRPNNYLIYKAP